MNNISNSLNNSFDEITGILSLDDIDDAEASLQDRVTKTFNNYVEQQPTESETIESFLPFPEIEGNWNAPKISKTGRVRFESKEYGSHAGVIYIFLNQDDRSCYVGCTETTLRERLSNYSTQINDPSTTGLYQYIRENPTAFSFAVLTQFDPAIQDSRVLEKTYIEYLENLGYTLYNGDSGGGGGYPLPKDGSFDPLKESPLKLRNLSPGRTQMKTTPTKLYPMTEGGFLITPNGKRQRGVYCIIRKEEGKPDKRYIGRTDRDLATRAVEHTRSSKKRKIYIDMKENPDNFAIGMLYDRAEEDPSSALLEKYATRKAKERDIDLYNERMGGGGTTRAVSRSKHHEE